MRLLCVALAWLAVLLAAPAARADTVTVTSPHRAVDLAQALGVNVHDYGPGTYDTGNAYQLYAPGFGAPSSYQPEHTWKKWMCDSGIKTIRWGAKPWALAPHDWDAWQVNDLYESCGVRTVLNLGEAKDYMANIANLARGSYDAGSIVAVELQNEPAINPTDSAAVQQQRDGAAQVRAWLDSHGYEGMPIIAPSPTTWQLASAIGPLDVDYGNWHPYAGGLPPEPQFAPGASNAAYIAPSKPLWFTELGYHTGEQGAPPHPGVSEAVQANYLLRTFLDYADRGARMMLYELMDEYPNASGSDGEQHFGLVRRDFTPKPAYTTLQRVLTSARYLGQDGTGFAVKPMTVTVDAPGRPVRVVVAQRSNGNASIYAWQPVSEWDRVAYQPISVPAASPVSVTVCYPSWPYALYLNKERPETPGSFVQAGPAPANVNGCRTWPNWFDLDGRVVALELWK